MDTQIVLTRPTSLEADPEVNMDYLASTRSKGLLGLMKNVRPGVDLNNLPLPAVFNFPKSQLQMYGEIIYSTSCDLLKRSNTGKTPIDRLIDVVAWSLSMTRPVPPGVFSYTAILGETHHVSKGSLNVLIEKVSSSPSVICLHATDEKENMEVVWCINFVPKFSAPNLDVQINGKRRLKLLKHGETYEMNSPYLSTRFIPSAASDWAGKSSIRCIESGLEAELNYSGHSFLGLRGSKRSIKGKITDGSSSKTTLYEISGHWDSVVSIKNPSTGEVRVIYDAKEVMSGLKTPIVKDPQGVWPTESAVVWAEVSKGLLSKDVEKATTAKKALEDRQMELRKERESRKETWVPKHFTLSYSKEEGWECVPIQKAVPPAPIVSV